MGLVANALVGQRFDLKTEEVRGYLRNQRLRFSNLRDLKRARSTDRLFSLEFVVPRG